MRVALHEFQSPSTCGYLPDRLQRLEYIIVQSISSAEYQILMEHGWRHFGHMLFRPACEGCVACRTVRIDVQAFSPNRNQRRVTRLNAGVLEPTFTTPACTPEVLRLYDAWHDHQSENKGWPAHFSGDGSQFVESFIRQPFSVEQWEYRLDGRLVGTGYVDVLPQALSAIYFFYDFQIRDRSPGIWNVLSIIEEAKKRNIPHVYLGYLVEGCPGMAYKGTFHPAEVRELGKDWQSLPTL